MAQGSALRIWQKRFASPESELRIMMQALLEERCKTVLHGENREMSVLLITVAKNGHQRKEYGGGIADF